VNLESILIVSAYPQKAIADLFLLETWQVETELGPGWVRVPDLLNHVAQFVAGGYGAFDPGRPTTTTAQNFQSATAAYGLQSILGSKPTWDNAAIAALFAISVSVPNSVFPSPPTPSATVLQACLASPSVFPFSSVTSATVAAAQAA